MADTAEIVSAPVENHDVQGYVREHVGRYDVDVLPEGMVGFPKSSRALGEAAATELFDLYGHDTSPENIRRLMAAAADLTIGRVLTSPNFSVRFPGIGTATYSQPPRFIAAKKAADRLAALERSRAQTDDDPEHDPL